MRLLILLPLFAGLSLSGCAGATDALIHGTDFERKAAVIELRGLAPAKRDKVVLRLSNDLAGASPEESAKIISVFGEIGPEAKVAIPAIIEAALHPQFYDPYLSDLIHTQAANALLKIGIGPNAKAAIPFLITQASRDGIARQTAIKALVAIGPASVPALIEQLQGSNHGISAPEYDDRKGSIVALALIGPAAKAALPALVDFQGNEYLEKPAMEAIKRIAPGQNDIVPSLVSRLNTNGHGRIRHQTIVEILKIIGTPDAMKAIANWEMDWRKETLRLDREQREADRKIRAELNGAETGGFQLKICAVRDSTGEFVRREVCTYANPATGKCSCPAGTSAKFGKAQGGTVYENAGVEPCEYRTFGCR